MTDTRAEFKELRELVEIHLGKNWLKVLDKAARARYAPRDKELEATIDRLRGQLQACVSRLEKLSLKSYDESLFQFIESANKALYETL